MNKLVFLDIDGTLVDFNRTMPISSWKALEEAKKRGHSLLLCTGRTYSDIYPWLLDFGFDGIIASAGAHVIWKKEELFHSYLDTNDLKNMYDLMEEHHASVVFQSNEGRYMSKEHANQMFEYYHTLGMDKVMDTFRLVLCEKPYAMPKIESGMFQRSDVDILRLQKEFGKKLVITGASFGTDRTHNGEFTGQGITKATGMELIIKKAGLKREDTIAFGDGPNDFEMLKFAMIGVAMGNAGDDLKRMADIVTNDILQDGILNGFRKVGLIDIL